jgi:hypothetical protein
LEEEEEDEEEEEEEMFVAAQHYSWTSIQMCKFGSVYVYLP